MNVEGLVRNDAKMIAREARSWKALNAILNKFGYYSERNKEALNAFESGWR